jgi:hypothetical protein
MMSGTNEKYFSFLRTSTSSEEKKSLSPHFSIDFDCGIVKQLNRIKIH